ncbi:MAG: ribosomal protein S18-alanine N-acetyltransferase [Chloroflexia bacterium]
MPYVIEPMQIGDVPEVAEVEKECFSTPWPESAYRRELRNPASNRYVVCRWVHQSARRQSAGGWPPPGSPLRERLGRWLPALFPPSPDLVSPYPVAGFAGLWLMVDEAHVTTIGVAPPHRGRHVGEMLFLTMIDAALDMRATWLTLEVRVSNTVAQNLYKKYGLTVASTRRHYYSDDGEDAYLMWSKPLHSVAFREKLEGLRSELAVNLARQNAEESGPTRLPRGARAASDKA